MKTYRDYKEKEENVVQVEESENVDVSVDENNTEDIIAEESNIPNVKFPYIYEQCIEHMQKIKEEGLSKIEDTLYQVRYVETNEPAEYSGIYFMEMRDDAEASDCMFEMYDYAVMVIAKYTNTKTNEEAYGYHIFSLLTIEDSELIYDPVKGFGRVENSADTMKNIIENDMGYSFYEIDASDDLLKELEILSFDKKIEYVRDVYNAVQENLDNYTQQTEEGLYTRYLDDNTCIRKIILNCNNREFPNYDDVEDYLVGYYYDIGESQMPQLSFVLINNQRTEKLQRLYIYDNDIIRYIDENGQTFDYPEGRDRLDTYGLINEIYAQGKREIVPAYEGRP